jgi:hypothetical protein
MPELKELFQTIPGVERVLGHGEPLPGGVSLEVSILSLPHRFATNNIDAIPHDVPYLSADPKRIERLRPMVGTDQRLKIGLVWAGNPAHINDRRRSCPIEALAPLTAMENVTAFGLQKGVAAERDRQRAKDLGLIDLAGACTDFADLAAAMALMDLIITIDSAPAHLAGALARPAWLLLTHLAEWRWLRDRDDSPWYPTMRLFRQTTPGDWEGVVRRVFDRLNSREL